MSVDTHLKGKNTASYRTVQLDDLEILVAGSLTSWAARVHLDVKKFLFWRSFDVQVEHRHGPT